MKQVLLCAVEICENNVAGEAAGIDYIAISGGTFPSTLTQYCIIVKFSGIFLLIFYATLYFCSATLYWQSFTLKENM